MITNKKDWETARDRAWEHAARQYLIRCAEPAIKELAPLPEFLNALEWLKVYDSEPTDRNRKRLKKVLRELESGRKKGWRAYGYTAVGECYHGLCQIIWMALHPNHKHGIWNSSTASFAEACYCAAEAVEPYGQDVDWANAAIQNAYNEHWKIWRQVWDGFYTEFKDSWEEHQASKQAAA